MAKSLYEVAKAFYARATEHKRGQALLATARRYLGEFVFNFDVKDGGLLHFIYRDGQLLVKEGRGETGPGGLNVHAEINARDLWDILEGRLGVTDAEGKRKLNIKSAVQWDCGQRPYFSLWGAITRVGQDIVATEKVTSVDLWR